MVFLRPLLMPAIFALSGFLSPLGGELAWDGAPAGTPQAEPAAVPAAPQPRSPAPAASQRMVIHRAADGLFYVSASVNGEPLRFVVDTGATHTVLSHQDAARLGIAAGAPSARVQTAAGRSTMAWARLAHVSVGRTALRDVDAMVLRHGPPVSLLGQNMLARLDLVEIRGDQLTLG